MTTTGAGGRPRAHPSRGTVTESAAEQATEVEEVEVAALGWPAVAYLAVAGLLSLALARVSDAWWVFALLAATAPGLATAYRRVVTARAWRSGERHRAGSGGGGAVAGTDDDALAGTGGSIAGAGGDVRPGDHATAPPVPGLAAAGGRSAGPPPRPLAEPLSERELEVLALLAAGLTNGEIAGRLTVALGTVKSHVNTIYRKLEVANRAAAATRALELDLVRPRGGTGQPPTGLHPR